MPSRWRRVAEWQSSQASGRSLWSSRKPIASTIIWHRGRERAILTGAKSHTRNRQGLQRTIPESVKLAVRQRCGFGCVMCGCGIVQYEHFDPPFANAKAHTADGITLLCASCHDKATRGIVPQDEVRRANRAPYCKTLGVARDVLFVPKAVPSVVFGGAEFVSHVTLLFDNEVLLAFLPPEEPGGPVRLHAKFADARGPICEIRNNEWQVRAARWDARTTGKFLEVRNAFGEIALRINLNAKRALEIARLRMHYQGFLIQIRDNWFSLQGPKGGTLNLRGRYHADVGVWLRSNGTAGIASGFSGGAVLALGGSSAIS